MNCICYKSELYDYTVLALKEGHECTGDWIMKYGVYVGTPEYAANPNVLISYTPIRYLRAFIIGEAQRLIEYEHGGRRPIHRILELKDGEFVEIVTCSQVKSKEQIDREIAVLKEYGLYKGE